MAETADDWPVAQAAAYARGRPDYPVAVEGWLRRELGLGKGKVAVDLGSGTGKFLPRLMATGADVIAVEPLAQMRSQLVAVYPEIDAREGRAQAIPLADASVDAVTCAMCFHLFAAEDALAEIRRVLKPGGALGLLWNIRDATSPWVASIIEIMAPYDHGAPRFESGAWNTHYESGAWRSVFPAPGFSKLQDKTFANPQTGSPETIIIDRVLSVSAIARLPREEREHVVARIRDVIAGTPELAGKQQITYPNTTYAYSCRKLG